MAVQLIAGAITLLTTLWLTVLTYVRGAFPEKGLQSGVPYAGILIGISILLALTSEDRWFMLLNLLILATVGISLGSICGTLLVNDILEGIRTERDQAELEQFRQQRAASEELEHQRAQETALEAELEQKVQDKIQQYDAS